MLSYEKGLMLLGMGEGDNAVAENIDVCLFLLAQWWKWLKALNEWGRDSYTTPSIEKLFLPKFIQWD